MSIKLVIFDLDGTLLYTLEDLKNSVNFALEKCNLKKKSIEQIRQFVGNGIPKLIERVVEDNKEKYDLCFEEFKKHYEINANTNTYPYEGIVDVLKKIKEKGIYVAILSNKADIFVKALAENYFKGQYDIAIGQGKYPTKPDPKSTLYILEKYKIKNDEAYFIGDSEVDIFTAKNAKIKCLSATWGYKDKTFLLNNGATALLNNPNDILNYL